MSEKQKIYLEDLIKKTYRQRGVETESFDDYRKELISELLRKRSQLDQKRKGESSQNLDISNPNKGIESLDRDEIFFCINRIKCDYLISRVDKQRIIVHFTKGPFLDYEEISRILKKEIRSIGAITDNDFLILLNHTKKLTFYRIQNFKCDSLDIIYQKTNQYEIGYEKFGKIYYIKFYYLLMIDIDNLEESVLERVYIFCKNNPLYLFSLYRTNKGYHLFCLSHLINHQTTQNLLLQDELHGDSWYANFCYNYGYKVRISHRLPKINEQNETPTFIARFIKTIGTGKALEYCESLLKLHDDLLALNIYPYEEGFSDSSNSNPSL